MLFPRAHVSSSSRNCVSEKQDFLNGEQLRQEKEREQLGNRNLGYGPLHGEEGSAHPVPSTGCGIGGRRREPRLRYPLVLAPASLWSVTSHCCHVTSCVQSILTSQCPDVEPELLTTDLLSGLIFCFLRPKPLPRQTICVYQCPAVSCMVLFTGNTPRSTSTWWRPPLRFSQRHTINCPP